MATTIVTKYGSDAPADTDIVRGELAVDTENGRLYTENSSGAVVELGLNPEGALTADAGIDIDNINIDGTTIALSSGDLTLDVAGNIILDADGGQVVLKDGGTQYGNFLMNNSGDLSLHLETQDKSIKFSGSDGGVATTALTLDMAAAGAATFNSSVTSAGLHSTTAGTSNFIAGVNAGNSILDGGNYNVVVGDEAGTAITTGDENVAVGYNALITAQTASQNTAVGASALKSNTSGQYNSALGREALKNNNSGAYNTAVGRTALALNTTASSNTAVGYNSLAANETGAGNAAVGVNALLTNTTGTLNSAFGQDALGLNISGVNNVAVGESALYANTTASNNTAVGKSALVGNLTANNNVAVGAFSLSTNSTGDDNVALGYAALRDSTTASNNTAVGYFALESNETGAKNTAVGALAGDALTTGGRNTALGYEALSSDTKGDVSVAIGNGALKTQNFTSATDVYNVAVGHDAGTAVTEGIQNTFLGGLAGAAINVGGYNVVAGFGALSGDTKGNKNTAIGWCALETQNFTDNTPSNNDSFNTALGYEAGHNLTSGKNNTFVGGLAGDGTDDGAGNVAVGFSALSANCGSSNTAVGSSAGLVVTGQNNTLLGNAAGLELTSGSNNLFVGKDAGRTGSPGGSHISAGNRIVLGNGSITHAHVQVDWTVASDARDKTDFTALDLGLEFVKDLQPVTYKWDKRSKYGDKTAEDYDLNAQTPDGTHKEDWLDIGFKAQEVEALEIAAGYNKDNKTNLISSHTDDGKQMGLQYSKFVPILVKAIQEQQTLIESLTARIAALEE